METGWLEDFLAVADITNFSRAAEQRNITQPALSRRIRQLEEWIGVDLFNRGTHQINLTPAGESFLPVATEVLLRLQLAREQAIETANSETATIRFLATHVLSLTFFPKWLRSLGADGNMGPVNLVADTMQACEQLMLQGAANFLLCHHHESTPSVLHSQHFQSVRLGVDTLVPVAAADGAAQPLYQIPGSLEAPIPLLTYSRASGMGRILVASRVIDDKAGPTRTVFTSHAAHLRSMTLDGRGVSWLPRTLIEEDLDAGRLVLAGAPAFNVPMEICLVRPRARQTKAAEAFWTQLTQSQD